LRFVRSVYVLMKPTSWFKVFWLVCKLTSWIMSIETLFFSFVALSVGAPVETSQVFNRLSFYSKVKLAA